MFVIGSEGKKECLDGTCHRCFLPSVGSFGKADSEKKNFRNRPIRNKNFLWRPRLLMDQDEMNNLYRWPSIDAFYQDSVHLANRFQRRKILKISQSETRITCGGHVWKWIGTKWGILKENLPYNVDAYYQVSDHLTKRFKRRRFIFKWTNPIQELPGVVMFVNGSGRNEQTL